MKFRSLKDNPPKTKENKKFLVAFPDEKDFRILTYYPDRKAFRYQRQYVRGNLQYTELPYELFNETKPKFVSLDQKIVKAKEARDKWALQVKSDYEEKYDVETVLRPFCRWWGELNTKPKSKDFLKMRWELQPTFEVGRRLGTWNRKENERRKEQELKDGPKIERPVTSD